MVKLIGEEADPLAAVMLISAYSGPTPDMYMYDMKRERFSGKSRATGTRKKSFNNRVRKRRKKNKR